MQIDPVELIPRADDRAFVRSVLRRAEIRAEIEQDVMTSQLDIAASNRRIRALQALREAISQ